MLHLQEDGVAPSSAGNLVLYLLNKFGNSRLGFRRLLRVFVGVRFVAMEYVATVATIHDLSDDEGVCGNEDTVAIGNVSHSCRGTEGVTHTEATCSTVQRFVDVAPSKLTSVGVLPAQRR